jgi:hypothetical protein
MLKVQPLQKQKLNLKQACTCVLSPLREDGGADRDRTDDILLAKQALSQLSYSPIVFQYTNILHILEVVGLGRFELPTSPLSGVRSNQLSYRPGVRQLFAKTRSVYPILRDDARRPLLSFLSKGFEDTVEHAERLRRLDHRC